MKNEQILETLIATGNVKGLEGISRSLLDCKLFDLKKELDYFNELNEVLKLENSVKWVTFNFLLKMEMKEYFPFIIITLRNTLAMLARRRAFSYCGVLRKEFKDLAKYNNKEVSCYNVIKNLVSEYWRHVILYNRIFYDIHSIKDNGDRLEDLGKCYVVDSDAVYKIQGRNILRLNYKEMEYELVSEVELIDGHYDWDKINLRNIVAVFRI